MKNDTANKSCLTWEKELPTKPGWYWRRTPSIYNGTVDATGQFVEDPSAKDVCVVEVRNYAGDLAIGNSTLSGWPAMERAEWAGPIQTPLEPTK